MPYMQALSGEVFHTLHPYYHKDCVNLGNGEKAKQARREYARAELRKFIPPGATVYYDVKRVSSSGMHRVISFYVTCTRVDDGRAYIRNIDCLMGDACGISEAKGGGLSFGGCGMNMGFSGVYSLGRALFPGGFGTEGLKNGKRVRAKNPRHAKLLQARGYVFRGRNGDSSGWDTDGGYALTDSSL